MTQAYIFRSTFTKLTNIKILVTLIINIGHLKLFQIIYKLTSIYCDPCCL